LIKTPAIVIWTLKYGDSSLIANCYTKKDGLKGYILNGILKSKKRGIKKALFQPFNLINIISDHKKRGLKLYKRSWNK
jgi:DNA repair protein RecO (recombination protein O)